MPPDDPRVRLDADKAHERAAVLMEHAAASVSDLLRSIEQIGAADDADDLAVTAVKQVVQFVHFQFQPLVYALLAIDQRLAGLNKGVTTYSGGPAHGA